MAQCPTYRFRILSDSSPNRRGLNRIFNRFRRILGDPDNGSNAGPRQNGHRRVSSISIALRLNPKTCTFFRKLTVALDSM